MRYFLVIFVFSSAFPLYAASHHPQDFLKSIEGNRQEGQEIYKHFCSNCHSKRPLINIGAPRYRVKKDWTSRITQGLDSLFQHSEEGFNAMPARGGCFECTDYQLILAIVNMLPKTTQNDALNELLVYKKIKK